MTDAHNDPFEQHRAEQLRRQRHLSYEERLRWLDGAKKFCQLALGAARPRRAGASSSSASPSALPASTPTD